MHAPNHMPNDGLAMRFTHSAEVQKARGERSIEVGPRGTVHDYVPFYFGLCSPMMLNLKTGRVQGYNEGQRPLIYLVADARRVHESGCKYVFTDGQALSAISRQFDDIGHLSEIDWQVVGSRHWANTFSDGDRQRRKQAEFLVHKAMPWSLITAVAVFDRTIEAEVTATLAEFGPEMKKPVKVMRDWYFRE
jgi:hypothetical protein